MMTTEVTAEEYSAITGYNPSFFSSSVDLPVGNINWHETVAFANTITNLYNPKKEPLWIRAIPAPEQETRLKCTVKSEFEGTEIYSCSGFRLPTEAEWELGGSIGNHRRHLDGARTQIWVEPLWAMSAARYSNHRWNRRKLLGSVCVVLWK